MRSGDYVTSTIRLARPLAQGGMGSVWIAEHLTLQIELVVKFCLGEAAVHPELSARFQREAALAMRARGPHVVQIFDHGETGDGTPYIAMELLHGEDLAARLERDRSVTPAVFSRWLTQAADGLANAHAVGVVHRDIKPSNLFLCHNGGNVLVKVLDFGIAKNAVRAIARGAGDTVTGALLGTLAYMSPEQIRAARDVDFRSDLWSLGVVTYQALTGERPFLGDGVTALAAAAAGRFKPVTQGCPELPKALDAWMATALAVDPACRFSSAKEMASAFAVAAKVTPLHLRASQRFGVRAFTALTVAVLTALAAYGMRERARQTVSIQPSASASRTEPLPIDQDPIASTLGMAGTATAAPAHSAPSAHSSAKSPLIRARPVVSKTKGARHPAPRAQGPNISLPSQ